MAPLLSLPIFTLSVLFTLGSALSITSPGASLELKTSLSRGKLTTGEGLILPSTSNQTAMTNSAVGWSWYYVADNGSQITPLDGP